MSLERYNGGGQPVVQHIRKPEDVAHTDWTSFRNEVGKFPSMQTKIGGVPVAETVSIDTYEPLAATPNTSKAALPIGWTVGDVMAQSDAAWFALKNLD